MEQELRHSGLEKLKDDLWLIEGSLPHHIPLPRNMIIFRTPEHKLWIHSPVAVDDKTQKEIEALGKVTWIVVPNEMHRMDAGIWKKNYPEAKVLCPKAALKKVRQKVEVDELCEDEFSQGKILAHPMPGVKRTELAYELDLEDGRALVVNDLLVNIENLPGLIGKLFKLTGRLGRLRVPTPQRFLFLYQRNLFQKWLQKMASRKISIVTVSHGRPVMSDVSLWLSSAAQDLLH